MLAATSLVVLGLGIGVWLAFFPPTASTALEKRLIGSWEGSGSVSGDMSINIHPGQAMPGGKTTARVTAACTVQAEFRSDGTYTWNEQHLGEGTSKGFDITIQLPGEGDNLPRWEVSGARGKKLTARTHYGEVVFDFQDDDAFTMTLPEYQTSSSRTITFHRAARQR
jgi:hypothetical protein